MGTKLYKRVYVWEFPVRLFHWLNAAAILVLVVTGLFIGDPLALMENDEAYKTFVMGTVRYVHFVAAYVLLVVFLLRIYWGFVGNKYARWKNFLPFGKNKAKKLGHVIKHDILLVPEKKEDYYHELSIGHNPVASTAYLIFFVLLAVMVLTGFGLYSQNASWWLPKLFSWVPPLLGGDFGTRLVHHTTMWLIILFIIVHVYLVIYHDVVEARGEVSSMISGYKFARWERFRSFVRRKDKIRKILEEPVEEEMMS